MRDEGRRVQSSCFWTAVILTPFLLALSHGSSDDDIPDLSKYVVPKELAGSLQSSNRSSAIRNEAINASTPFVRAKGTKFVVGAKETMYVGTNAYYLMLRDKITDVQVERFFLVSGQRGLNLVRFFPFINGYGGYDNGYGGESTSTPFPLQTRPNVFDEATFQRLDLILAKAAENGIRVIMPLSNFEAELGGIKWWVDSVLGVGKDQHLFYTDRTVIAAYKNYTRAMLSRNNTITNITYIKDPTIFAVELLNEPHTAKLYEKKLGLEPGKMVREWVYDMAAYVRSIDPNHMISTGEEGYRSDGPTDGNHINWLNGGYKGVDFVGNLASPNISFATVHCYPDSFQIPASDYTWIKDNYIADRARLAHAASKPWILEEYGGKNGYAPSRSEVLQTIQSAANANGAAATLVWQVFAWPIVDSVGSYDFDWDQDGSRAEFEQIHYADMKNGKVKGFAQGPAPEGDGGAYAAAKPFPVPGGVMRERATAAEGAELVPKRAQRQLGADVDDVAAGAPGVVDATAEGVGGVNGTAVGCSDIRPPRADGRSDPHSCKQQAVWGQCGAEWMRGFCLKACGVCGNNTKPATSESTTGFITPVQLP